MPSVERKKKSSSSSSKAASSVKAASAAAKSKGKGKASASASGSTAAAEAKAMAALPLGKQLAHTDKAVRDSAIRSLEAFLSRGSGDEGDAYEPLSDAEMAKLWKGLFYCFWMSDKPLVQQQLASDLANLLLRIDSSRPSAALDFLAGFWTALVREWSGIDRLRIDKYYMLIRKYVNATFRLLAREGWESSSVARVTAILGGEHGPMCWKDIRVPSALASHLADVYLDELEVVLSDVDEVVPAPIESLLAAHIALLARTRTQAVHNRLMSVVFTPALKALSEPNTEPVEVQVSRRRSAFVAADEEEMPYPHIAAHGGLPIVGGTAATQAATKAQLKKALLAAMFKEAAQEGAVESNRRKIYAVVRAEDDEDDEE